MTNIQIKTKNNNIVAFTVSGHTGYDNYGKDILCSAVSSITQSACLGIVKVLKINAVIKKDDKKGYLKFELPKNLSEQEIQDAQIILKTMHLSLKDLLSSYSDYIKLEVQDEIY